MQNIENRLSLFMSKNHELRKIGILTLMCLAIAITNGYFFDFLNDKFFHLSNTGNDINKMSRNEQFLIAVIIAPLIETLVAQFMLVETLRQKITNQKLLILLSSLFFAFMHYYSWLYIVVTFFGGLILNYYYLEIQKISKYSFFLTALLHSLYNLYGFLFVV